MADIVRYQRQALDATLASGLLPARLPRHVVRRAQAAAGEGLVSATHVQAAAYVAHVGLTQLQVLGRMEETAIKRDPVNEARYRRIVDTVGVVVEAELLRFVH